VRARVQRSVGAVVRSTGATDRPAIVFAGATDRPTTVFTGATDRPAIVFAGATDRPTIIFAGVTGRPAIERACPWLPTVCVKLKKLGV
jgi:hypothetical protein